MIHKIIKILLNRIRFGSEVKVHFTARIAVTSQIDKFSAIYEDVSFEGVLGSYSYVAPRCNISAYVGKFSSIGPDVHVLEGTHPLT